MSERNHSRDETKAASPPPGGSGRRFAQLVGGTVCLLLTAAVVVQFTRANPAQSQTEARPQQASASTTPQVFGHVNGQPILYEQVARECVTRHGEEILDSLINRMIIQQACEKQGVVVKESEIKQEVSRIAEKFNLPLDAWYQMLQAERKITPDQYHKDIIWPMLALKKLAGQEVTVTEEDMKRAFERDYGPRVEARVIFIDGNQRQAAEIWEKCRRDPDQFEAYARQYSADSNSRPLGGVVPPIRRHNASTSKIEEEAFKLKPGEISGMIQTRENQYVILKCEGQTDPIVTDIQDVWTELREALVEEKTQLAVAEVFESLKKESQVINYLTQESTAGPKPGQLTPATVRQTSGERPAGNDR
jgi:foldase protein PrsA